ncbi:MAG: hypothetical protein K8S27_16355 [Candidatus Omnitrophica bacterium]|nr:hypothetical protein [Candidatus Omnitrophota bacterium]
MERLAQAGRLYIGRMIAFENMSVLFCGLFVAFLGSFLSLLFELFEHGIIQLDSPKYAK